MELLAWVFECGAGAGCWCGRWVLVRVLYNLSHWGFMRFNSWVAWELGAVAGCGCWRLVRGLGAIYFKPWGFMRINSWDSWESVLIIGFIYIINLGQQNVFSLLSQPGRGVGLCALYLGVWYRDIYMGHIFSMKQISQLMGTKCILPGVTSRTKGRACFGHFIWVLSICGMLGLA